LWLRIDFAIKQRQFFEVLRLMKQLSLLYATNPRSYTSLFKLGGMLGIAHSTYTLFQEPDFSVSIDNTVIQVPELFKDYPTLDLQEYLAAIGMTLEVLNKFYKARGRSDTKGAVEILSEYAHSKDANLSQINLVFSMMPGNAKKKIMPAFSEEAEIVLDIELNSGNLNEGANYIFSLEPGTRWPALNKVYDKHGRQLSANLLAAMVEISEKTTARILMDYQRSTLTSDDAEPADNAILQMFLDLGALFPMQNYQQRIIAACESLELCGDFLLDISKTGAFGFNEELAVILRGLAPVLAVNMMTAMYQLEQERAIESEPVVEQVIRQWDVEDTSADGIELPIMTLYIMSSGEYKVVEELKVPNATKVEAHLANPIDFVLDEEAVEELLLNGRDDSLSRMLGRHIKSKGMEFWVDFLREQLALDREYEHPIKDVVDAAGGMALGIEDVEANDEINDEAFMSRAISEIADGSSDEKTSVLGHLLLGLLPNKELFPDENWKWLLSWFKRVSPLLIGEVFEEAYRLNRADPFTEVAQANDEGLDEMMAAFLETMNPEDAAKNLSNMDPERANRILSLIRDQERVIAILQAMARSDDTAIRDAFIEVMDNAEPDRRALLIVTLMLMAPHLAWEDIHQGGSVNAELIDIIFESFRTAFQNNDPMDMNEHARGFAAMLENATEEEVAGILRELLPRGEEGATFVGLILSHMDVTRFTGRLLDRVFLPLLENNEAGARNAILTMLRSLLYQSLLGDNMIDYRIRRIIMYLCSIPGPGGNSTSLRLLPVFSSILESDLRSYFLNHLIDLQVWGTGLRPANDDDISFLSSLWTFDDIDPAGGAETFARDVRIALLRALVSNLDVQHVLDEEDLVDSTTVNGVNIYNLSDTELVDFLLLQDPLTVSTFLFTDFIFIPMHESEQGGDPFPFNDQLTFDRAFRIIRLLAERAQPRWLGLVLMPVAERVRSGGTSTMVSPDSLEYSNARQWQSYYGSRLGRILSRLATENRSDLIIRIMDGMIASVSESDTNIARFMIARAVISTTASGQPEGTGLILASMATLAITNTNIADLVLPLLDHLRTTLSERTFVLILSNMALGLDQLLDQIGGYHLGFIVDIIYQYALSGSNLADLASSDIVPFARIFAYLANHGEGFNRWIITMLQSTANSNGTLTRAIARIFNSMIVESSVVEPNAGTAAIIRFISAVLSPDSGFTEPQRRLLGALFNEMVRSQTQGEAGILFAELVESPGSDTYIDEIFAAMRLENDGADNIVALILALAQSHTSPSGLLAAFLADPNMAIDDGAAILVGIDPGIAADVLDEMAARSLIDRAAQMLLAMNTQNIIPILASTRDTYPAVFTLLRAAMMRLSPDSGIIDQELEDYFNEVGSGRRNSVLSYNAIGDSDGDPYWEPLGDNGLAISETDHHFAVPASGVRRERTSALNHAYYFDGTGVLTMGSLQDLKIDPTSGSATFEMWVRPLPQPGKEVILFESGGARTEGVALTLSSNSVNLKVSRHSNNHIVSATSSKALPANQYSHVVGVIEASAKPVDRKLNLYVNGELVQSVVDFWVDTDPDPIDPGSNETLTENPDWCDYGDSSLGGVDHGGVDGDQEDAFGNLDNFKGWISEFHFYDRALDAAEISSLYQLHLERPDLRAGQWIFEQSVWLSWSDVSGAEGYNIYRTEKDVNFPQPEDLLVNIEGDGNIRFYFDTDVEYGKAYRYWVTSHNHWQESEFSEVKTATVNKRNRFRVSSVRVASSQKSHAKKDTGQSQSFISKDISDSATRIPASKGALTEGIAKSSSPKMLVLSDYEGGGLAGVEINSQSPASSYLTKDEFGDTMKALVADKSGADLHYIKRFDVAADISTYDQLSIDCYSTGYDPKGTLRIQLRFANKDNPGVQNFWDCKSPVSLSSIYGDWTRVQVDLSERNFQRSGGWQPGNGFNLDRLEGIAVHIVANGSAEAQNIIYLDNIELMVNEDN
jgi:hypothetical protein